LRTALYCNGHYQQLVHEKPFKPLRFGRPVRVCRIDGCTLAGVSMGLCPTHSKQQRARGMTWDIGKPPGSDIHTEGSVAYVILTDKRGRETGRAMIDSADIPIVKDYKWFSGASGYAQASPRNGIDNKLWMHRLILGIAGLDARQVKSDHINGTRLDNRRANLRIVTPAENAQNAVRPKRRRLRGVSWDKKAGRWSVHVGVNGSSKWGGYFDNLDDAIQRARALRAQYLTHHVEERHA
jgi:hypothetical protein